MPLKAAQITIKAKWKMDDSNIISANTFQCFFSPYGCFLYVGSIGPEKMLEKMDNTQTGERIVDVITIAKYSLDIESFLRLKNEIDKAHKKLLDQGVIKNE